MSPELEELKNDFRIDNLLDKIDEETYISSEAKLKEEISELEKKIQEGDKSVLFAIEAEISYPNDKDCSNKYLAKLKEELVQKKNKLPEAIKEDIEYNKQKKERFKYDGVEKAAFEHGIKIIGAESLRGNIQGSWALDHLKKGKKDKELEEMIFEDREDILLRIIAKQEKPLIVCVYGGAHSWGGRESFGRIYPLNTGKSRASTKDNIAIWNKGHPDKQFSLYQITLIIVSH
ncbi:MAG: hypothetical protein Q8N99_00775 [Nanoarchaeota archaeon]|nr:hypothetical protein [Nanoarchaeota archaeon]